MSTHRFVELSLPATAFDAAKSLADMASFQDDPSIALGQSQVYVKHPHADELSMEHLAALTGWLAGVDRALLEVCQNTVSIGFPSPPGLLERWPRRGAPRGRCVGYDGLESFVEVESLINYLLVQELSSNPDSYMTSVYVHRFRGGRCCSAA